MHNNTRLHCRGNVCVCVIITYSTHNTTGMHVQMYNYMHYGLGMDTSHLILKDVVYAKAKQ